VVDKFHESTLDKNYPKNVAYLPKINHHTEF